MATTMKHHLKAITVVFIVGLALRFPSANAQAPMGFAQSWPRNDFNSKAPRCFYGGVCLATRDYVIELQLRPFGKVKTWIRSRHDANEKLDTSTMSVEVSLQTTDQSKHRVELRWDPSMHYFMGFLPGKLHPASGTVQVTVRAGKKSQSVSGPAAVTPHGRHGGVVIAAGSYALEVMPFADGRIEAYPVSALGGVASAGVQVAVLSAKKQPLVIPLKYSDKHKMFLGQAPQGEQLATGPIELEVRAQGRAQLGSVIVAKPIPTGEFGGWNVITGPYTVSLSRVTGGLLVATVRDAHEQIMSPKNLSLEAYLQIGDDVADDAQVYSLSMRYNADKARYEAKVPTTFEDATWVRVGVIEAGAKPGATEESTWRNSVFF